jgi:hypothetical protein
MQSYMSKKFGRDWLPRACGGEHGVALETEAVAEILWRAAENSWFKYPLGSTLLYFCFLVCYRSLALEGVKELYKEKEPTSKHKQPLVGVEEKEVLQKKIQKFIDRRYLPPIPTKFESLIKYFAIPKGVIGNVVQDWRVVFHTGANKLNNCVCAPWFCLPSINSLERIVDKLTLMSDHDMMDMFHNFPLHWNTVKFTAIDLAPLGFGPEEFLHCWWLCWKQNLMGSRSSPYNSIQTYLVTEEVIRGDWHDHTNPFQWECLMLNLPGSPGYQPSRVWISKRRADNLLASNFVCFVDNQQVTGSGKERVREAGHAISTQESYLGLQDALRKIRAPNGSRRPGAWAGANICIEEDGSIMILTLQEKWDRLKNICKHWLGVINLGTTDLDFKRLQSDCGFLVYITQAYPGMKPYLKGFHLSLETWRGSRDDKGWKVSTKEEREMKQEEVGEGDNSKIPRGMEDVKIDPVLKRRRCGR